jgi:hypothetical protein
MTGAPYLPDFGRCGIPRLSTAHPPLATPFTLRGRGLWNPTSREKRARCGAPVIRCAPGSEKLGLGHKYRIVVSLDRKCLGAIRAQHQRYPRPLQVGTFRAHCLKKSLGKLLTGSRREVVLKTLVPFSSSYGYAPSCHGLPLRIAVPARR